VVRSRDDLRGVIFWGRPDEHDVDLIVGTLDADAASNVPTCASLLVDMRRLQCIDLLAFDRFFRQLRSLSDRFGRFVARQAVIHRGGLLAAVAATFCAALDSFCLGKAFAEPLEAIAWLGLGDRTVLDDLDRVYGEISSNGSLLLAVRRHLRTTRRAPMAKVAEACGVSPRTLQRRLRELGTSFQQETSDARLRAAKILMTGSEYPLKHIALDCGFASLQHFSAFFCQRVGTTPSRWRALHALNVPAHRSLAKGAVP
jgi:AraC-like DNA-binding protein